MSYALAAVRHGARRAPVTSPKKPECAARRQTRIRISKSEFLGGRAMGNSKLKALNSQLLHPPACQTSPIRIQYV